MLTSQSVASKISVHCATHELNRILYFCSHVDCNVVLCVECKEEHSRNHKMKGTTPILLSFPLVVIQVKERLATALGCLKNFLDDLESKDLLEQKLDSINLKQKNQGLEEAILEIESLRSKWRGYLCSIQTNEASGVLKSCYNVDFQKIIRSLEDNIFKRALLQETKLSQGSPFGFQRGLGSILEQIRSISDSQSQPKQDEKDPSPKAVSSAHCRTYLKRPSQLIVPLTPTNSNFLNNPRVDVESSIPVSPAMTIMEDSQATSPLTGETFSLNEFSAKWKSRYGLSPFSLYNTRRSEVQIDTFEMIEEEQGDRF